MARADAPLVKRTLKGDKGAFGELVRRHQTRLLAAAIHLVGDREAAQDLTQEAFLEAYRGLGRLREDAKFGGWLYGILRIRCRRYLDRKPPPMLSLEADDVPEPIVNDPGTQSSEILPLLSRLPQESREILAARYLRDMSYAEIAEMLGITDTNVRVKCFRARQALRELLTQTGDDVVAEGGAPS